MLWAVFHTFLWKQNSYFLTLNNRINHHIEGGTRESHPNVQDLQSTTRLAESWMLQILDTRMGFPHPSLNVVIDYFSHSWLKMCKICLKCSLDATFLDCLALTFCDVIGELHPEWACLILQGGTTFRLTSKFLSQEWEKRISSNCQRLAIHKQACWAMDVANLEHKAMCWLFCSTPSFE